MKLGLAFAILFLEPERPRLGASPGVRIGTLRRGVGAKQSTDKKTSRHRHAIARLRAAPALLAATRGTIAGLIAVGEANLFIRCGTMP